MANFDIPNVDLSDDEYKVEQSLVRNKYKALDDNGNVVLRGKQKMMKMKEEFPFEDKSGEEVFQVKAGSVLDVAGDYSMLTPDGDEIASLEKDFTLMMDKWKVRHPDNGDTIAKIESQSEIVAFLRTFSDIAKLFPHKYDVMDSEGNVIGTIEGEFSVKDKYQIQIDDLPDDMPKEVVVASAMVIDAIEGN